jgi:hypothetical protein
VQKATSMNPTDFVSVTGPITAHSATIENCCGEAAFFRVQLLP